jgi:Ca-activated chloride channel family protein
MFRISSQRVALSLLAFSALMLLPRFGKAQGVLINVETNERVVLPRPIIIEPPYYPHPHPRPVPIPESTYKIKELEVDVKLAEQVAKVQVAQSFVNTGSRPMEVCFVFPLPYDGAVDQLTLLIDGKEYPAKLLPADEARHMYEEIVRKNRDPALLEWMGTGLFKTSVFPVPPGAERKVTLRYSQLCRKTDGLTDFLFPLSTAKYTSQPVESIKFNVAIDSQTEIKNVYSPTHAVEIKRPDDKHAVVSYKAENKVPTSDFRLFYDVGQGHVGATVLSYRHDTSEDGYFLLLASPEIKAAGDERPKKTVVFVVDRSGSMSGEKIDQAKGAAKFVLNNLREGDLFNIIAFDSEVESWKPELQKFNDETRKAALGFIEGIYAGGSTNIDGALEAAFGPLHDSSRPTIVLFLTDGLPTVGEQNEAKIVENSKKYNKVNARVYTFGVGYDLNSRLLDKLAREGFGQSEFVRPNENIEDRVSALYKRISAPVMSELSITWDVEGISTSDGKPVNRVYPKDVRAISAGEQLVIVGRYKKPGDAKVVIKGKVGDKEERFDFPAKLVEKSHDEGMAFIEKLWAVRRIGEILDELDLKGKNDELVKELVTLSRRHGVLTPYTSFMADENSRAHDVTTLYREAGDRLQALSEVEGQIGVEQREAKEALRKADAPTDGIYAGNGGGFGGAGEKSASKDAGRGFYFARDNSTPLSAPAGSAATARLIVGGATTTAAGRPADKPAAEPADEEAAKAAENVRAVGRKVFYRHGDKWVDSAVTAEQEKQPIKIERYSKDYFNLIDKFGRDVAKYMTFDDPVVIELDGKAYSF